MSETKSKILDWIGGSESEHIDKLSDDQARELLNWLTWNAIDIENLVHIRMLSNMLYVMSNNLKLDNLNREQAVMLVGEKIVKVVESENCVHFSSPYPGTQKWTASINLHKNLDTEYESITVVYLQSDNDFVNPSTGDEYEDGANVNWKIDHYETYQ